MYVTVLDQWTLVLSREDDETTPLTRALGKGSSVDEEQQRLTKAWGDFVNAGDSSQPDFVQRRGFKKRRPGVYWNSL